MNGRIAKKIRRYVYQDQSLRNRTYIRLPSGQLISDKLRHTYLKIKKTYKINHNILFGDLNERRN